MSGKRTLFQGLYFTEKKSTQLLKVKLEKTDPRGRGAVKENRPTKILALSGDKSLYVTGLIKSTPVKFLIDTGSSISLIARETYEKISEDLMDVDFDVCLADGKKITILGKFNQEVTVGSLRVDQELVVADLHVSAILGMDFLMGNDCKLDLKEGQLDMQGAKVKLWMETDQPMSCRVSVYCPVTIPSKHGMMVEGKVHKRGSENKINLMEGSEKCTEKYGLIIENSLTNISSGKIIVNIMNPTEEDVHLYAGTTIGICQPINEIVDTLKEEELVMNVTVTEKTDSLTSVPEHLADLVQRATRGMIEEQSEEVIKLLTEFQDIFVKHDFDLGKTDKVKHVINTGDAAPIRQRPRRVPIHLQAEAKEQVDKLLKHGLIEHSTSPWASPIVLVKKKDGSWRHCIDYRALNSVTKKDAYPLPDIATSFDTLQGADLFSTLDFCSGYLQVEVAEEDREKTAFVTKEGLFQYKVMPFGLTNAVGTFERLMEHSFAGLIHKILLIYLDDIIVFSKGWEEQLERLRMTFERIRRIKLKLKPKKCNLFQEQVIFLGHLVSKEGITTDPSKIEAVKNWPQPKSVTDVRSFLGFCSYYRKFIEGFSQIASPLHKLTEKTKEFEWNESSEEAFNILKQKLISAPILTLPSPDCEFILDTDASDTAIGAVLSQVQNGVERVMAYASKSLGKAERRYCVTRKELLAVVNFIKHFKHYLLGRKFLVRSDHGALRWLFNFKEPEGQIARWLETLAMFNFEIKHRPGKQHGNADGLSRQNCKQCGREEMVRAVRKSTSNKQDEKEEATESDPWVRPWTKEELSEKQKQDPKLNSLFMWMENGEKPSWQEISLAGSALKTYWNLWETIHEREGVLYRKVEDGVLKGEDQWKLLVPDSLKEEIMKNLHDHKTASHFGNKKTIENVKRRFYWYDYRTDVELWIKTCKECASRRNPTKKPIAKLEQAPVGVPFERVHIDILGSLPKSKRGKKYILVVTDWFTKWTEAYAIPNQEAATCAKYFVEQFICRFGTPRQVHTDQGTQFESVMFKEICRLLDIEKSRTTAYHPAGNGIVERFNRTLEAMLSKFVEEHQRDWDEYLPLLLLAYRSSVHESTRFSPNKMVFGREVAMPVDVVFGLPPENEGQEITEHVAELRKRLEIVYEFSRENLRKACFQQKSNYDKRAKTKHYNVGDLVWLWTPSRRRGISPKLQRFWKGPYAVVKHISNVLYRLKIGKEKTAVVHFNRLKPHLMRNDVKTSEKSSTCLACDRPGPVGGVMCSESSDCEDEETVDVTQCEVARAGREGDDLPESFGGDDPQINGVVAPEEEIPRVMSGSDPEDIVINRRSNRVRNKPSRWGYPDMT
jgi:hypothetical protein